MNININIENKRPAVMGAPVIVCGNSDYVIEFTFDDEWNGAALKTARFVYTKAGEVKYQDVAFGGTTVSVPVLSDVREVYVGVYAGDLCTTTPARISCDKSILCGTGTEHEEPDPDVYNQILAACNQLIGEAGNHLARTDNPHKVTAAQVGLGNVPNVATNNQTPTYSAASTLATLKSGETLATSMGKIMKAITDLISHIGNKSNPHGVTASQAGARSNTWLPTLEEIGAQKLISIGQYTGDLNDRETLLNTVAWVNGNAVTNSPSTAFSVLETWGSNVGIINQRFATTARCVAVRMYYNGTWTEWEWDNPPMALGVEYRTTKRHKGLVVYTMCFSFGTLPKATIKKVKIPSYTDANFMTHMEFIANSSTTDSALQLSSTGDPKFFIEEQANDIVNIVVETTGNFSGYTGEVTLEYTK